MNKEEIDNAIGAHGSWKVRLKDAIETGRSDIPVETIRKDNNCQFGKWLYGGTLSAADKTSANYTKVRELHAEFHKAAARVTELALAGQKTEADKMMTRGGEFAAVSSRLTSAMMDWKKV